MHDIHSLWNEDNLSERLLTGISENKDIKRALFPPVGPNASTSKGGGKTKVAAQWQLCIALFGDDPKYKDVIAAATTPKEQLVWANKVKNRLRIMARITRKYITEMGETGAGITCAADIDTSVTNSFTTKWQEISASCPWFFEMRELIGQRPNLIPVGLGNSESEFDVDVLNPAPPAHDHSSDAGNSLEHTLEDEASVQQDRDPTSADDDVHSAMEYDHDTHNQVAATSDDSYHPSSPTTTSFALLSDSEDEEDVKPSKKGKAVVKSRKTAAASSRSTPAPSAPAVAPKALKKGKLAEFAEVARAEEVTRQKEIDLASIRARQSLKEMELRLRMNEVKEKGRREDNRARREQRQARLRMKEMKLKMAHELHLRTLATAGSSHTHAASFFDSENRAGSSSEYGQSDAGDSFAGSLGSMGAGPSSDGGLSFGDYTFPSLGGL
ncbi:hypothetical protein B0H14DRAFT_3871181 [Mycena olivaceomarginata]|nr:hypothetical protein B0H14DRAFT_3871181 [Mycena olivaceomarginata]